MALSLRDRVFWSLRRGIRKFGLDFRSYGQQHPDFQIDSLIKRRGIASVLDIGANRGQFAAAMRKQGFTGHIHSFEPLPDAFAVLYTAASADAKHHAYQLAASDEERVATLSVGANDQTSSLLPQSANPQTASIIPVASSVDVRCVRLDDMLAKGQLPGVDAKHTLLKLDVQGHELAALKGAGDYLRQFPAILLEAGVVEIYQGEAKFSELCDFLLEQGYGIIGFKGGFFHPEHGFMMQIDVVFENFAHNERALQALGLAGNKD